MWQCLEDHNGEGLFVVDHRGRWGERQLLGESWIDLATTSCPVNRQYGFLWWLNADRTLFPSASPESYFAIGAGANITWIDPAHDLVAVLRWIDRGAMDGFIARVMEAMR